MLLVSSNDDNVFPSPTLGPSAESETQRGAEKGQGGFGVRLLPSLCTRTAISLARSRGPPACDVSTSACHFLERKSGLSRIRWFPDGRRGRAPPAPTGSQEHGLRVPTALSGMGLPSPCTTSQEGRG